MPTRWEAGDVLPLELPALLVPLPWPDPVALRLPDPLVTLTLPDPAASLVLPDPLVVSEIP